MEPIRVSFTFNETTYIAVSRHLVGQMIKRQKKWGYLLVGILVISTATAVITGRWQLLLSFMLPIVIFIPVWRWSMERMYKKTFAQQTNLHHPITYTFTDELITAESFSGTSTMDWSAFQKVVEAPDFFVLYQNNAVGNPVLKSGFLHENDLNRFRNLVSSKSLF